MTFSLVGRCARTGAVGAVIASASMAVAARCAAVRAGVGAVCSQSTTDPRLRGTLLDALAGGQNATGALATLAGGPDLAWRQLAVVDAQGGSAAWTGGRALGDAANVCGPDAAAAGNLLAGPGVPAAMLAAFAARDSDELGDRLVAALAAGLAAGGEVTPVRSAGLLIARAEPWPETDLRVDWHDDPVGELARLWALWAPQAASYVQRALRPAEVAELCPARSGERRGRPGGTRAVGAGPGSGGEPAHGRSRCRRAIAAGLRSRGAARAVAVRVPARDPGRGCAGGGRAA
jgi:uncharacterized Ntn-hydrolase superfamily protein